MSEENGQVGRSFWVIGAVALLWHLMGVGNFIWQMTPEALASFPEAERPLIAGRPIWATAGFGLAVLGGAVGSILMLCRRAGAKVAFIVSLIGVVVALGHAALVGVSLAALLPPLVSLIVAAALVWYVSRAVARGWIS